MKFKVIALLSLLIVLFSCKNDEENRLIESAKDAQKKELLFSSIKKAWVFNSAPRETASNWEELNQFLTELDQKPKTTIGAFKAKAKELSKKARALRNNVPIIYNKPQIKARVNTLITSVQMLELYIQQDNIPGKKVTAMIPEINIQLASLQNQMDQMDQKSKIPLEEGESELLKMLDTTRAIKNMPKPDPNLPRVE